MISWPLHRKKSLLTACFQARPWIRENPHRALTRRGHARS